MQENKSAELVSRLDRLPFSKWHKSFFIICFFGVMFDAADFALFGAALPLISKEFGLGPAEAGLLASIGLVGAFVGALFWGTISDYIGRRTAFSATIGIFAVFSGLIALAWNTVSLSLFRFISNFGLGGEVPVTSTLASEYSPGKVRGRMTGLILMGFPMGLALAAGLALLIIPVFGWRGLFVVGVAPALLLLFVRRHMPESVRFLLGKGRVKEAEKVVETIETEVLGQPLTEEEVRALPATPVVAAENTQITVVALLSAERRRRTLLLWIVSFGFMWANNGILFMLPTILQQRGIPLNQAITFMLIQAIAACFGYAAGSALIDRFGRRSVLFLFFFVGAFCHLWFAEASGIWYYFAAAAVGLVNPSVFGLTGIYVGELHPTHLRATAVGWFYGIGRIASFLAPAVIGFMLAYGMGAYVLHTFALSYLVASISLWFVGVETKGRSLEEISEAA